MVFGKKKQENKQKEQETTPVVEAGGVDKATKQEIEGIINEFNAKYNLITAAQDFTSTALTVNLLFGLYAKQTETNNLLAELIELVKKE